MAITTLAGILAGLRPRQQYLKNETRTLEAAGILHSLAYAPGRPGVYTWPESIPTGMTGAALTSYAGQIPFTNPVSGNSYLARFAASASSPGCCILYDRLWHNGGIVETTTGAQAVNSVAWPARDRDGGTEGDGVMVAIEVFSATGNAGAITNTTMSYTNQAGTAGRTATIASFPATAADGTFVPFALQAGDTGIRSIQSLTLGTSYVSGAINLVAYRELAMAIARRFNGRRARLDPVHLGFPRLYNNTVPFLLWMPTNTNPVAIQGEVVYAQG